MALSEAGMDITAMAMESGNNSRYQGDETLLVKFYIHPTLNETKTKTEGRPIFEDTPHIRIMQPGTKDSIIERPATALDKQRFSEHYRKFEAREDQEIVEGTLLEEWSGVTRSQCEELRFFNIRTVEQLVNISDTNAPNFMGIQALKNKAKAYLEDADANAAKQALADQKEENARLLELIGALNDRLDSLEKPGPKKKAAKE